MSKDNGTMPSYVREEDFSEDLNQIIDDQVNKLYGSAMPCDWIDQSEEANLNNVDIPPTIPAKNDTEENTYIGDVETTNDPPNDNAHAIGAIQLPSDDTKPNPTNTATTFVDPRLKSTDDTPEDRQNTTGQNPHRCDKCDANFTTKQSLKNHKEIHTRDEDYKCKISKCNASYSRSEA